MPTGAQFLNKHAAFTSDVIDIEGETQSNMAFSSTATQSAALTEGVYDVWCDQDVYLEVGTAAASVTSSTGYLVRANKTVPVAIRTGSKIGAVRSSASGTLSWHKVG